MTAFETPPDDREVEFTLVGPGYGESIILHVGEGDWILVDSCVDSVGMPAALGYLERLGVDPAQAVRLIVATHWHDDHIRGMAHLVGTCTRATFCCASSFGRREFLATVAALEGRHLTQTGSGVREIHRTFSTLASASQRAQVHSRLKYALADRRLFSRQDCEIWSLSPDSEEFTSFLREIGGLFPGEGETKTRVPSLSPNRLAIALWVRVGDVAVLLGADVEKRGWLRILEGTARPAGRASAVKVPHHGSANAHEHGMWQRMLDPKPVAVLTPWALGGRSLPSQADVRRILAHTPEAYATAKTPTVKQSTRRRDPMVTRTVRQFGIKTRRVARSPGTIRLRRSLAAGSEWRIETFGSACHLDDYAAA